MRSYLLFAYEKDAIRGGWNDWQSSHATLSSALTALHKLNQSPKVEGAPRVFTEAHIVNIQDGVVELHAYYADDYGLLRWLLIAHTPASK